jgi:hypothetical protein
MSALEKINIIPPAEPAALTPMDMLNRAVGQGASIEVLEKLMTLQERWEANQARKAFDEAMAAAKAEVPTITKNREVDFSSSKGRTNYRHEDLAEIARTVDPILSRHGLSYRFRVTSNISEPVTVTCILSHRAGHSEETTLSAGRDDSGNKNSIQAVGSAITYLQRYTLKAALGLAASSDDDGGASEQPAYVSTNQLNQLVALADEVGADKEKFCRYLRVGSLAEIPAEKFAHAVQLLEAKRGK